MFRNTLIGLVFLVVATAVPAQTVMDLDGRDWRIMSEHNRVYYVVGFMSAFSSAIETFGAYGRITEEGLTEDTVEAVNTIFHLQGTVEQIMSDVTSYYKRTRNLDFPIWRVVLVTQGKDLWREN